MIAPPAGGAPLPVAPPVPPNVYYRDFFSDPNNDPFVGNYAAVLQHYAIGAGPIAPADLRTIVANARLQQAPTAFILQHNDDKLLHVYLQLERFEPRMGMAATPWDNQLHASKGELRYNHQQTVIFPDSAFTQTNQLRLPTQAAVDTLLGADGDPDITLGPFNPGDADTEVVRLRRTCFVPAPYVSLFLTQPLSPRQAWETVVAQMVTDGVDGDCTPLISFLKGALTVDAAGDTGVQHAPPAVPFLDETLGQRRRNILEADFPALNPALAVVQNNQIATQLGEVVDQFKESRRVAAARADAKTNKPPQEYLGPVGTTRLLRYCNVATPDQFPAFWHQISRSAKAQHLSILQWEITRVKHEVGEPDLDFTATAPLLETVKSLQWEMSSNDSIHTGLNNFLLSDEVMIDAIGSTALYELMHGEGAAPSLADAQNLLRAKASAPRMIYQSRQQTRRFEVLMRVILGPHHTLSLALGVYNARVLSSESRLHLLQADHLLLPTMLCKKIAVSTSNWFRNQTTSPAPVPVPNFCQIFEDIDNEAPWQPVMSPAFLAALRLDTLHHPYRQAPGPAPAPSPAPGNPPPATPDPGQRNNNIAFNTTLFGTYKDSGTPCRTVRAKINRGELPPLPMSKVVPTMEMCLGWHTKGMCNSNCSKKDDHVPYSDADYQPLVQWCTAHWPSNA